MLVELKDKKLTADKMTFQEFLIVSDYFMRLDVSEGDAILGELVRYREVTDVVRLSEDNKIHITPFAMVPAKLMKKIDRYYLEGLCADAL